MSTSNPLAIINGVSAALPGGTAAVSVTPTNITITTEAPNSGSTGVAGTPGSFVVALPAVVSTGSNPGLVVTFGGTQIASIQPLAGGTVNNPSLYFDAVPSLTNAVLLKNISSGNVAINASSTSALIVFSQSNTTLASMQQSTGTFSLGLSNVTWTSAQVPVLSQTTLAGTGATAGQTFTIQAQAGQAQTGAAANNNGGSITIATGAAGTGGSGTAGNPGSAIVAIPLSSGTNGAFIVKQNSVQNVALQAYPGNASDGAIYLGSTAIGTATYALWGTTAGALLVNSPTLQTGTSPSITFRMGNSSIAMLSRGGFTLSASTALCVGSTLGNNTIGIADALTVPTAVIAGCSQVFSASGALMDISSGGVTATLAPAGSGTINSQAAKLDQKMGFLRFTTTGVLTVLTCAQATSSTTATYAVTTILRAVVAETGGAIGDSWSNTTYYTVKNVAGTLTQVGVATSINTDSDTNMSTASVGVSLSGTNVLFQVTPPTTIAGNMDCTVYASIVVN